MAWVVKGWRTEGLERLLNITKQNDANVIKTVDSIRALIPELTRWIPAGIDISVLSDRVAPT